MKKKEVMQSIYKESEYIADSLSFELVDIEYVKEFGSYFLRIYIDKPGGINLEDCQTFSENINKYLDEMDLIKERYYLEVSSPGLDRPLKGDKDLKRNLGKDIEIKLYKSIDKRKNFEGKLVDFNSKDITIEVDDEEKISIDREFISMIRLKLNF